MTEFLYTTDALAKELGVTRKTIRKWAEPLHIGINLDGNAGYRYTEADRQKLIASLRPIVAPTPRKRKRVA